MFNKFVNSYRQAISGLPREVWYLALVMFINRSGSMVLAFLTLYVNKELGYSEQLAGMVIAIFGVGSILGSLLGGWLTDRVGAIRLQAIAFVLNAVGFVALYQLTDYVAFAVTLFLMSAAGEAFRPVCKNSPGIRRRQHVRARGCVSFRHSHRLERRPGEKMQRVEGHGSGCA